MSDGNARSFCRPLDRVCCVNIHQAAQVVCMSYMVQGVVTLVTLLVMGDADLRSPKGTTKGGGNLSSLSMVLQQGEFIFRLLSLWVGARGYAGVTFKSATHLQICTVYSLLYTIFTFVEISRALVICDEFKDKPCAELRNFVVLDTMTSTVQYGYMTYILWSSLQKIVLNSADPTPLFQLDEALVSGGEDTISPPNRGGTIQNSSPVPNRGLEPFSGQAHRLD